MRNHRKQNAAKPAELTAAGLVSVRREGDAVHVTLAGPMISDDGQPALVAPAWVDDAALSAPALRLLYHYLRRARDGRVITRRERASELCGLSPKSVRAAEAELTRRG